MLSLAFLIALAICICGGSAQNSGGDAISQPWFLNVTVGGIFDEIAQCAKACTLSYLEMTGCNPADPSCFCPIPVVSQGLDRCLAWFCPVLDYYEGLSLYHATCHNPVRNQGPQLQQEMVAVASIAFVALFLRFITRLPPLSIKWGADDWLAAVLVPVTGAYLAIILLAVNSGLGQDIWMLKPHQVSEAIKYYTFEEYGYVVMTFLTKMTVLAFYLRIFPFGRIHQLAYLFIAICVCLLVSIFLAHLLQCMPIDFIWQQWQGTLIKQPAHVTCGVQRDNLNFAFNITNVIMDGIIIVLPIPRVLLMELRWQRKLRVLLVFCVGFLVTGIAITRIAILLQFNFSYNRTWSNVPVVRWSAIEAFLNVAVTCFPQIHLLIKRIIGVWYKGEEPTQMSKPSFVSSTIALPHSNKGRATYENIELGAR